MPAIKLGTNVGEYRNVGELERNEFAAKIVKYSSKDERVVEEGPITKVNILGENKNNILQTWKDKY